MMAQAIIIAKGKDPSSAYDFAHLPVASALAKHTASPSEDAQNILYWYLQNRHAKVFPPDGTDNSDSSSEADSSDADSDGSMGNTSTASADVGTTAARGGAGSASQDDDDSDEDSEAEAFTMPSAHAGKDSGRARLLKMLGSPASASSSSASGRWTDVMVAAQRETVTTAPGPSVIPKGRALAWKHYAPTIQSTCNSTKSFRAASPEGSIAGGHQSVLCSP